MKKTFRENSNSPAILWKWLALRKVFSNKGSQFEKSPFIPETGLKKASRVFSALRPEKRKEIFEEFRILGGKRFDLRYYEAI